MKRKRKNEITVSIIKAVDLIQNSANKQGRHLDQVKSGTGVHKSKKTYDRKNNKKAIQKEMKNHIPSCMAFNFIIPS